MMSLKKRVRGESAGYKFGKTSKRRRATLHRKLKKVVNLAIKTAPFDFSIICGYRDEAAQNEAFANGTSRARYGESMHNYIPARAVDLAPYSPDVPGGVDWDDEEKFELLAEHIIGCADELGITLSWGGVWHFKDLPHFELIEV